jgi:pilus assembly protein CpaE
MRIVIADHQRARSPELRRQVLAAGLECHSGDVVAYETLPARIAEAGPELVLVVCDDGEGGLAAIRAAYQVTGAPILATGPAHDAARIREALKAGAREYLDLADLHGELVGAIHKYEPREPGAQRGTVIALYSPSGGVGVSTTAINLAATLAASHRGQVALAELKPAPGDLALLLDLNPEHTLDDVCLHSRRLDKQLLAGALVEHAAGVRVLAQDGYPEDGSRPETLLTPQLVRQIVLLLRGLCRTSVLDLDHRLGEPQFEAMRLANFVGLVTRPEVTALRRARWALDVAAHHGLERDRFRLILTHAGERNQIGLEQVERTLGIRVFQTIPEDRRAAGRAANAGLPLASLSRLSRLSRSFSAFARCVESTARSV